MQTFQGHLVTFTHMLDVEWPQVTEAKWKKELKYKYSDSHWRRGTNVNPLYLLISFHLNGKSAFSLRNTISLLMLTLGHNWMNGHCEQQQLIWIRLSNSGKAAVSRKHALEPYMKGPAEHFHRSFPPPPGSKVKGLTSLLLIPDDTGGMFEALWAWSAAIAVWNNFTFFLSAKNIYSV